MADAAERAAERIRAEATYMLGGTLRVRHDFVAAIIREEYAPLVEAVRFVKGWLNGLECGLPDDDPITKIRRHCHAPIHEKLDAALSSLEGRDVA